MNEKKIIKVCLGFIPVKNKELGNTAHLLIPSVILPLEPHIKTVNIVLKVLNEKTFPTQSKFVNNMLIQLNQLNLLNKYIGLAVEVRIRNYEEGQERLDPPATIGDGSVIIMASSGPMVLSYCIFRQP